MGETYDSYLGSWGSRVGRKTTAEANVHVTARQDDQHDDAQPATDATHAPISIRRRLGKYSIIVFLGGTLIIVGCMAFLSFLWTENESNTIWRRIVVSGWLVRSVTIVSLILRAIISTQATVATSIVAVLLLKWHQIRLFGAPEISAIRASNTGPRSLVLHLPRRPTATGAGMWALVLLMTAVTISLQFTSTALLSDVGRSEVVITYLDESIPYGIGAPRYQMNLGLGGHVLERHEPRQYHFPAFAEYTEPLQAVDNSRDTGVSMQAFLPIGSQRSRESLLKYTGPASVVDTRVVCFRPSIRNVSIKARGDMFEAAGQIRTEHRFPGAREPTLARTAFDCSFTMLSYSTDLSGHWPLSFCRLTQAPWNSTLKSMLRPDGDLPEKGYFVMEGAPTYLFINTTGVRREWANWTRSYNAKTFSYSFNTTIAELDTSSAINSSGEWATFATSHENVTISMALCALDSQARNLNRHRIIFGPEISSSFDTTAIRTQLGATSDHISTNKRGIFNLSKPESWSTPLSELILPGQTIFTNISTAPGHDLRQVTAQPYWLTFNIQGHLPTPMKQWLGGVVTSADFMLCTANCLYPGEAGRRPTITLLSSIFQSTIKDTGSVAHAFQAIIRVLASTGYHDSLPFFNATAPSEMQPVTELDKPTSKVFLAVVGSLLLLHLVLIAIVTAMFAFAAGGNDLIVGGAWAALAPVQGGEDTAVWLPWTSRLRDSQVKKRMKSVGVDGVLVGLESNGDRLRLRRRPEGYERLKGRRED
ncbi:hypothetical protein QBC44DRAFT_398031 [Cladorrhinum sp. PSN332]|nr:hypothetical protein QBC44DRAFT_398031 [Cladorrhinum sp. PSN332]